MRAGRFGPAGPAGCLVRPGRRQPGEVSLSGKTPADFGSRLRRYLQSSPARLQLQNHQLDGANAINLDFVGWEVGGGGGGGGLRVQLAGGYVNFTITNCPAATLFSHQGADSMHGVLQRYNYRSCRAVDCLTHESADSIRGVFQRYNPPFLAKTRIIHEGVINVTISQFARC